MACIEFLTNQANKVEGLAYSGFETFKGSPYTSCARETGQNSRDATAGTGTVRVSFNLLSVDRDTVPFADALEHSIRCCLEAPRDDKTREHLERALAQISAPAIKILEIADSNTTGLTGPVDDPDSVFTALVKGDGVTNKSDPTSAGSYGIGKNAAYAVSDLQTVIYSTRYLEEETEKFAAQGRLRLISHTDGEHRYSAEGYWGEAGFSAIEDELNVPAWARRTDAGAGTSIFSVGFREEDHWAERMTLSLANNFFLAINRGEIEFTVNGSDGLISTTTIDSVLGSEELEAVAQDVSQLHELVRARRLMRCIHSELATRHRINVDGLGEFTLHLLVAEGLPKEVHILRNGIYISDNFAKFGQPMKRYPGTQEFIAILEPSQEDAGKTPSQLLKRLENPAHDAFEPERIVDASQQARARRQIKSLIDQVRAIIRDEAKIDNVARSDLNELSHLFAAGGSDAPKDNKDAERDPERFKYSEARKSKRQKPRAIVGKGAGKRKRITKEKAERSERESKGTGSRKPRGPEPTIPLVAVRSILPDSSDTRRRSIFFTAEGDGDVDVEVAAAGLSGEVALALSSATSGKVANGKLRTSVKAGQRVRVDLQFTEPYAGPIELTATTVPASFERGI